MVKIAQFDDAGEFQGTVEVPKLEKPEAEWKRELGAKEFEVTRLAATERPFTGPLNKHYEDGVYRCVCCGTALFDSESKFDSGCGWPAFSAPIAKENIEDLTDRSYGMRRVENRCSRCDAHLGMSLKMGRGRRGLRYCVNSAALTFSPRK